MGHASDNNRYGWKKDKYKGIIYVLSHDSSCFCNEISDKCFELFNTQIQMNLEKIQSVSQVVDGYQWGVVFQKQQHEDAFQMSVKTYVMLNPNQENNLQQLFLGEPERTNNIYLE